MYNISEISYDIVQHNGKLFHDEIIMSYTRKRELYYNDKICACFIDAIVIYLELATMNNFEFSQNLDLKKVRNKFPH